MLEHRESNERPFFNRVRVWDEDPDVAAEGVYLEVTRSGDVLAFGHKLARARMPGGADHGFPRRASARAQPGWRPHLDYGRDQVVGAGNPGSPIQRRGRHNR